MTTYKYSVPWFEVQTSAARCLKRAEWTTFCVSVNSVLPKVSLPATQFTEEYELQGGRIQDVPASEVSEMYTAIREARAPFTGHTKKQMIAMTMRVNEVGPVLSGLHATHAMFLELSDWVRRDQSRYAETLAKWAGEVAASTFYGHVKNNKLHWPSAAVVADKAATGAKRNLARPLQLLEAVRKIKSARHAMVTKTKARGYFSAPVGHDRDMARRRVRSATAGLLPAGYPAMEFWSSHVLIQTTYGWALLATGDLQRLEQYAANWLNLTLAMVMSDAVGKADGAAGAKWFDEELRAMSEACVKAPPGEAVHVCRAYRQAYTAALASHAGNAQGYMDALNELQAMPLAEESGAIRHHYLLRNFSVKVIVDYGKAHKALPADSDLGAATAYARFEKAKQENPKRDVAEGRPPLDDSLFEKCLHDEITRALRYKNRASCLRLVNPDVVPAWYEAWSTRMQVPREAGWSMALDIRGAATAPARSDYAPGTFKDSALAPDRPPTDATDIAEKEHTNMALRRFVSPVYPTQEEARNALLQTHPRTTKADQKPENYKHPLRLFYEATLLDRMGVSWTEACIYSVAQHHPCYMMGRGPVEVQTRARSMISPPDIGRAKRFFSFDVSNWSAGMSQKVQRISGAIWAKVFDDERIGCAYNVMHGSTVYVQKHGVLAGYKSPTANFEGYDGKAMTMVHVALMSATIQRTRQMTGDPELSAELMAYIDDGAAAIETAARHAKRTFEEFILAAEEVYGYERFILHPLKCMPSDRMFTFLNEVYYAGAHEVSATKAVMRIASEPKEEHESLPDRVMVLSSGTQGAVQAGLNKVVGALSCYFLLSLELLVWAPSPRWLMAVSPVAIALKIMSPAAYYGLAVPSPIGFEKTGKGASLSEGIAAMLSHAASYPSAQAVVAARLRTPLPKRSWTAIMRNPTGHSGLSLLKTNRVAQAVSARLSRVTRNDVARKVMEPAKEFDAEAFGHAMFGQTPVVSATAIKLAWSATPCPLAEAWVAKFESSRTIARLIGSPTLRAIMRQHKRDAMASMSAAFSKAITM